MASKLQKAIEHGKLDAVIAALESGANIEEPDMHGYPGLPLRTACFNGDRAIVTELLKRGADIHAPNSQGIGAPIRMAAKGKHKDIILLLLEHGADLPPDVNLPLSAEEVAQAKSVSSVEYHPDTEIKELSLSQEDLHVMFKEAAAKKPNDDDTVDVWDRIYRLD